MKRSILRYEEKAEKREKIPVTLAIPPKQAALEFEQSKFWLDSTNSSEAPG